MVNLYHCTMSDQTARFKKVAISKEVHEMLRLAAFKTRRSMRDLADEGIAARCQEVLKETDEGKE